MAFTIPTLEPTEHEAGTSLIFTRSFGSYPADTWTLSYALRNTTAAPIDITATADGKTHSINEAIAITETWTAGDYAMRGYVTDGTDRHLVYDGRITIAPYLAGEMAIDTRTHARKMLDAIEAGLIAAAGSDVVSYSINNRSFTRVSQTEAQTQFDYWKRKVRWEERKGQMKIKVRFR